MAAAPAVPETDLSEPFRDDAAQFLIASSCVAGVEQTLRVIRGEMHGEPAEPSVGRSIRQPPCTRTGPGSPP